MDITHQEEDMELDESAVKPKKKGKFCHPMSLFRSFVIQSHPVNPASLVPEKKAGLTERPDYTTHLTLQTIRP